MGQKPYAEHRETEITVEDVTNFMVDYMRNDNLGLIATAHKIHADLSPDGAMSDICLKLAEMHSIAVDFPKSGVCANFQQNYYSVREHPDFLGKHESCSYTSQKALGKLYRAAQPRKFRPFNEKQLDCAFLVQGFDVFVQQAQQIKRQYDYEVKRLMKHVSFNFNSHEYRL
jgi:RNA-dependent RNA polymerase